MNLVDLVPHLWKAIQTVDNIDFNVEKLKDNIARECALLNTNKRIKITPLIKLVFEGNQRLALILFLN